MSYRFFDLDSQYDLIKENLELRLNKLLSHKKFINGPEVLELEEKLKSYFSSPYVFGTNSGTSALTLALMSLDLKSDDEVITSPASFGATVNSILLAGAVPVFVDIEAETGLIDANSIEQAITLKTKAILPVSLYGQPADMDPINKLAKKYNLKVIEDACQSFGAVYKDRKSGTLSDFSTFSFFPAKPLGSYGNAGCLVVNNSGYAEKIRAMRSNGQSDRFFHEFLGFNALMNSFQATVLLEKLNLFEKEMKIREKLANRYNEAFTDMSPYLNCICVKSDRKSARNHYVVKSKNREQIMKHFHLAGRPLTIHYPTALFDQPILKDRCKIYGNPDKSRQFMSEVFSLPFHPYLSEEDQEKTICLLKELYVNSEDQ